MADTIRIISEARPRTHLENPTGLLSWMEDGRVDLSDFQSIGYDGWWRLWGLTPLARPTKDFGSGSWLPTPSGVNGGTNHTAGRLDEWGGNSNPFRGTSLQRVRCAAFEEWMMGLGIRHTELTPSEMRSPRKSHKCS